MYTLWCTIQPVVPIHQLTDLLSKLEDHEGEEDLMTATWFAGECSAYLLPLREGGEGRVREGEDEAKIS